MLAKEIQQELSRPDRGKRISYSFACNVGCRAVNSLEETWIAPLRIEIGARSQSQAAGNRRSQIREDVAKEIGSNNDIQALWPGDKTCAQRVDKLLLVCYVRVLCRHLPEDFIPEDHIVLHAVGLGGAGDLFAAILPGILERVAHDPLRTLAGKDSRLDRHFVLCPLVDAASSSGILALGILTNAHDIDILWTLIDQWTVHPWQQAHWPQVDILVKSLPHRQQQTPQRDVVC